MKVFLFLFFSCPPVLGQSISAFLPHELKKTSNYLFYLHGQVVTELGDNAINQTVPEWGPYEFTNILDSLKKRGFNVISEIRQKGVNNKIYVDKIVKQTDSLLKSGVPPSNIFFVGASAGWDIVLHVSSQLKNESLHFVIMGGCWADTYKDYINLLLYGNFLSIIEKTDPHGTCKKIFENSTQIKNYEEIVLNTGLSHGFIYKGYKEWLDSIVNWVKKKK